MVKVYLCQMRPLLPPHSWKWYQISNRNKLNYWSSRLLLKCILHCSCLMNVYYRHTFNEYFNQNVKESRFYLQNKKEYTILAVFQLLCLQKEFTVHLDGSLDLTAFPSKMKQSPASTKRYCLKDMIDKDVIK